MFLLKYCISDYLIQFKKQNIPVDIEKISK